jgi:hypothetical protein
VNRSWIGYILGCLVVAALVAAGGAEVRARWGSSAERAREQFAAAVGRGDSQAAAAAIAGMSAREAASAEGRLLLAGNALLAGDEQGARAHLGDPALLPEAQRCEGLMLRAGIVRTETDHGNYAQAVEDYRAVIDGSDPGCAALRGSAVVGLRVACLLAGHGQRASCQGFPLPRMMSEADRQLLKSVVLAGDGHEAAALDHVRQAVDGVIAGQKIGCPGVKCLRRWARPGRLTPGSDLSRRVSLAGRRLGRTEADCALFSAPEESL